VAASKNAHRKAGMIAVRNVRFWGFYVPFSWSNRRLAQQANRLSWGRRFCTAAFCQALTAFFAVRSKNLAVSYPKIIRVSVHLHGVPLTGHIDCMSAH